MFTLPASASWPRLRYALLAGAALGAVSCSGCRGGAVYYVALGVQDELPDYAGRCATGPVASTAGADGAIRFLRENETSFVAQRVGESTLSCAEGSLILRVRPVARLQLDAPAHAAPGSKLIVRVTGLDADGTALRLGNAPTWTVEGGTTLDRCNHMVGSCLPASAVRVRTADAGPTTLRVQVGEQHLEQRVEPTP